MIHPARSPRLSATNDGASLRSVVAGGFVGGELLGGRGLGGEIRILGIGILGLIDLLREAGRL